MEEMGPATHLEVFSPEMLLAKGRTGTKNGKEMEGLTRCRIKGKEKKERYLDLTFNFLLPLFFLVQGLESGRFTGMSEAGGFN